MGQRMVSWFVCRFSKPATNARMWVESWLELKFFSFSVWHFVKLIVSGFLQVLQFPPLLHKLMVSANKIKLK